MRHFYNLLLIVCLCALSSLTVRGQQGLELNDKLPFDPQVKTGLLPNGMTYYIRHNARPENRADLRLVVHAGSVLEDNNQQGLAHFTEHMAFNGTKHYPKNELENFLESNGVRFGAHLNAYTSFDETVYMLQLPVNKANILDKGMEVLADWAHEVSFDPTEIDKERGVVIEEWRLGRGAEERVQQRELPVLLANSQYALRLPIGQKPLLDTFHYETIRKFYHDWYRPDLMAIIAVGDFDAAKMEQQIRDQFGSIPNPQGERARTIYDVPPHSEMLVSIDTDRELQSTRFQLLYLRPDHPAQTVADYRKNIVGNLYDEMLNTRLQEYMTKGNAPFVFANANDGAFLGNVRAYGGIVILKPDSVMPGIKTLLSEIFRAKALGFSESELDRAKKNVLNAIEKSYNERDKTESSRYTSEYASYFLKHNPAPGIAYRYQLDKKYVPTITLAEVNGIVNERFTNASPVMTFVAPSKGVTLPTKQTLLDVLHNAEHQNFVAYEDKPVASSFMTTMPTPGRIVSEKRYDAINVTDWTLSNGAHVVLKPTDFKDDQILLDAQAWGGTALASNNQVISAALASQFVDASGIAQFDATEVEKMMAGKSANVSPYVTDQNKGLRGESSKKDLETLFQLSNLYFTAPRIDPSAVTAMTTRIESFLKNRDQNPETAFSDTLSQTLNQYSPRTKPFTIERLKEVQQNTSWQFYKDRFKDAAGFTFYFVGNFDVNAMRPLVEKYIASIPSSGAKESYRDEGIEPPNGVIKKVVYKGSEPKSKVSIIFHGPFDWSQKNRYDMQAMTEALNIKLREDLREEKSGVYGIRVSSQPEKYPKQEYTTSISFGCAPDRVDELVGEIMKQIDTITTKPLELSYLNKVKELNTSELETSLKENNYWMQVLTQYSMNDEAWTSILDRKNLIQALTQNDVEQAARKYLDRNNYVLVELFPEKKF